MLGDGSGGLTLGQQIGDPLLGAIAANSGIPWRPAVTFLQEIALSPC